MKCVVYAFILRRSVMTAQCGVALYIQLFTEVEVASRGVYRTAKQLGKYPRLATDTEVNNCFSIY